ncbi:MAG: hypothetical protein U9N57_14210 [Pseudomonadota bacterium]|nr:hypothetical protein [Pseudomonadota bacterium]
MSNPYLRDKPHTTYGYKAIPSKVTTKVAPSLNKPTNAEIPVEEKVMQRRKLLTGTLASLFAGGALMSTSQTASAMPGLTASAVAALQVFMEKAADQATEMAVDIGKDMVENWTKMFSFTTDTVEEQGSLNRTTAAAIADSERAYNRELENKRITAATQAPVSSCTNEAFTKILMNDYPRVQGLRAKHGHINLNRILSGAAQEQQSELLNQNKAERTRTLRETYPDDEFLDVSLLTKESTFSESEEKAAEAYLVAGMQPFEGKLKALEPEALDKEVNIEKEVQRQSLKSVLSNVQDTRATMISKRVGTFENYQTVVQNISSLESSKDSRDRAFAEGLKKVLKQHEEMGGQRLSTQAMNKMLSQQRLTPEYSEAIQRMGAEPAPYLKEMVFIERDAGRNKVDTFFELERTNALLADLLQIEVQKSIERMKPLQKKLG